MTTTKRVRKIAIATLAVAAIAVPSANGQPIDYPLQGIQAGQVAAGGSHTESSVPTVRTVEVQSNGFDWGDAGLGAVATLALLGLGTGALMIGRRARTGHTPATS